MTQHEKDVEKVARAIKEAAESDDELCDWLGYQAMADYRTIARAALAAMKPAPLEPIPGSGPLP